MSLTKKEISLQAALQYCNLVCLPTPYDEKSKVLWVRGLALVRKITGEECYVAVENEYTATKIKKDFGTPAKIIEIVEIYPYEMLEGYYSPHFKDDESILEYLTTYRQGTTDDYAALLNKQGKSEAQIREDRKKIRGFIKEAAMKMAQRYMNDEAEIKEKAKNYQERIKKRNGRSNKSKNIQAEK